jgi:alpha-L-fucosidase
MEGKLMTQPEFEIPPGPFQPTWESLENYTVPQWYSDGKFGIFIHWGLYSVPAFGNEWYPRNMYRQDTDEFKHHVATYGPQKQFGYKDFIPLFKAEKYDPDHWADIFRRAGAKFVVPVAEHHDGFAMYDTRLSEWCAARMGPRRDLIGDLAAAVRKQGMVFGVSNHRAEHWWFMNGGKEFDSDVRDERYAGFYNPAAPEGTQPDSAYLENWLARLCELVDKYQPQLFWFDWWIEQPVFAPYLQRFAAYYYNRAAEWGRGVAINYKNKSYPDKTAVLDLERGQLSDIRPLFWQNDTSVSKNSWGYVVDQDYKAAESIVGDLADIVSKNGALLLNVGPRSDGMIPEHEEQTLLQVGNWLSTNGEAIYSTRPWKVYGEGPTQVQSGMFTDTKRAPFTSYDVRYTTRDNVLYAIVLAWPTEPLTLQSFGSNLRLYTGEVGDVQLLGASEDVYWTRDVSGLQVTFPVQKPCDYAYVLKITPKSN